MAPRLQLILGGARSGKSRFALSPWENLEPSRRVFLATATVADDEMRQRIERHLLERGEGWETLEEPYDLAGALGRACREPDNLVVVDCATLWVSNLLCGMGGKKLDPSGARAAFRSLFGLLPKLIGNIRIVSNEVGLGIVPDNLLARNFQDLQGELNREIASLAEEVFFLTAGIARRLK
jgi:adenosylcobinamide kinase/adenosylcobinamide-phosphate guanylyltransferase